MASPKLKDNIDWQLVDATEVPDALQGGISASSKRIAIESMHVVLRGETEGIFKSMVDKFADDEKIARASVIVPDAYSLYFVDEAGDELTFPMFERVMGCLRRLGSNAKFGRPYSSGVLGDMHHLFLKEWGRNHRKSYVFDDYSLSWGGCNLNDKNMLCFNDFLVAAHEPDVARFLTHHIKRSAATTQAEPNERVALSKNDIALLDGGGHRSEIIDIATVIAQDAEPGSVRFLSQYRPSTELSACLDASDPSCIVFNAPNVLRGLIRAEQYFAGLGYPLNANNSVAQGYNHAKMLSAVLRKNHSRTFFPEGGPVLLTGSHNFHGGGVRAGTKEIALLTSDPSLIQQANDWADSKYLKK